MSDKLPESSGGGMLAIIIIGVVFIIAMGIGYLKGLFIHFLRTL